MEDFYITNTSQDISNDYNSTFKDYDNDDDKAKLITQVVTYIIICIGLPLTLLAIYALYSLVGKDHVAPIYVINLLISDLIEFCCMIGFVVSQKHTKQQKYKDKDTILKIIYYSGLVASVCFMVLIALERYLVIAWPLWYRFRRTIKISVVVCVLVWVLSLVYLFALAFWGFPEVTGTVLAIFFLLPLPLLIFFLGGTLKALSASVSVPADRKRRIVGMLVLVLVIYLLLFLPRIILFLKEGNRHDIPLTDLSSVFVRLFPLADLFLYVFMRKGAIDKLLASVCCCRMDSNDANSSRTITGKT
ncbi:G-protein coupled receptor 4-like isoform X1 [Etheostoma spectabile]|uniref:G-protein coupled receptor 4-like isoform X1 n=1 Tax=Etheostoma spectabile TaxID=54343 RepID=UPI0013AE8DAF|nr:G-protein coupled receptor 4-like isoform X1 [Etheostoma spectabile]